MLKVGERAPAFEAASTRGKVSLAELRGRPVVVFFFPEAFAYGCQIESRAFRDRYPEFQRLGAEVIGVSPDSAGVEERFGREMDAPFPLVADPKRRIVRAFGAHWPAGASARRATFVLDAAGVLRKRVLGEALIRRHVDQALDALRELAKP